MLIEEFTIWISGNSGTGKSTLATTLKRTFDRFNVTVQQIDAESLIQHMVTTATDPTGLDEMTRFWHSFNHCKKATIVDSGHLKQEITRHARIHIKNFIEILLECQPAICLERTRDLPPQDNLSKISSWLTQTFSTPEKPDLRLDTGTYDSESCSSLIVTHLMELGLIGPDEDPQIILKRLKSLGYIL